MAKRNNTTKDVFEKLLEELVLADNPPVDRKPFAVGSAFDAETGSDIALGDDTVVRTASGTGATATDADRGSEALDPDAELGAGVDAVPEQQLRDTDGKPARSRSLRRIFSRKRFEVSEEDQVVEDLEADDEVEVQDSLTKESAADRSRLRRIGRAVVRVGAALIFAAALCVSGLLYWQQQQRDDVVAAGQAALAAAKNYAVELSSIDSKEVDKNFAKVLDGATGEFKGMYSQSSAQLRQLLIDNKAVSHGAVIDAAIKSATKTRVEVLIFLDQSISNAINPGPNIDRMRMLMTMELIDNRWLASHVEVT
jgi:Mce-associated membrane protein